MAETSDSEEELFLTQSSFNGSSNRGNELEKFVSSNNRQVDHKNAQFNVEETEELFSFYHSDEHQEVSIGSVEKETKANKKKASKRDIIVVDDKDLLARNSERIPKNTRKVNFWCLNVWNEWAAERNALPQNSADLFFQVKSLFCLSAHEMGGM